jgi:hypothetical protein
MTRPYARESVERSVRVSNKPGRFATRPYGC